MENIAKQIEEDSTGNIVLGVIDFEKFADGFPKLYVKKAYDLRWVDCAYLVKPHI